MLFDPLLHLRETRGVGGRRLVIVSNMDMGKRGAGLEGLLRQLDLLGRQIGTAGLSFLRGTEPVMATATTTGFIP